MSLDQQIKDSIKDIDFPIPLFDFSILNVSFLMWKKPEFHILALETRPYEPDGTTPLIMVQFAFFELLFYNKTLHRLIYRLKNGYDTEV